MIIEIMLIILAIISVIVNTIVSVIIVKDTLNNRKWQDRIDKEIKKEREPTQAEINNYLHYIYAKQNLDKQNKSEVNTNVTQASTQNREGIQNQIHDVR